MEDCHNFLATHDLESIFAKYDADNSGKLNLTELGHFLEDAFPENKLASNQVKSMLDEMDTDGDGSIGTSELRAFWRHYNTQNHTIRTRSALIIIDVQNDFITGTMANPYNAEQIVPIINSCRDKFDLVVVSLDWHPQEHCSFVESVNAGLFPVVDEKRPPFSPGTNVTLAADEDRKQCTQTLYPRHAVQNTQGSTLHADLKIEEEDLRVYKGVKPNIDSYSAFFDNCKANDTGLTALLDKAGITDIYCCGLVFDICVKSTALHGAEMGFRTVVLEDASRPYMQDKVESTKVDLKEAGVEVMTVQQALDGLPTEEEREITLSQYLERIRLGRNAPAVHGVNRLGSHGIESS